MSSLKSATKLVSVGIPVYNESARIVDCIKHVQAQTYPNIEICISDNNSSDGTYELAHQLAEESSNIRLTRQERNMGAFANFGAARHMAGGEYFMWLGADDRILPTYIEKMVEQLERHPKAVVAQSAILRVDDNGDVIREVRPTGSFNPNNVGPLRQAMLALSPFKAVRVYKFNLYTYGLYRKSILDRIMDLPENILNKGDRLLPAIAALSGGLRYVDEFLFAKHVYKRSYRKRHPKDPLMEKRLRHNKLSNLIGCIFTCPTIPLWRRWYGIIIVLPFLLAKALKFGSQQF